MSQVAAVTHALEDGQLVVRPRVVVSGFDSWIRRFVLLLSAITIVLMIVLLARLESLETVGEQNRAIFCRELVLDGIDLDPDGACYEPEVLKHYDPETGGER